MTELQSFSGLVHIFEKILDNDLRIPSVNVPRCEDYFGFGVGLNQLFCESHRWPVTDSLELSSARSALTIEEICFENRVPGNDPATDPIVHAQMCPHRRTSPPRPAAT